MQHQLGQGSHFFPDPRKDLTHRSPPMRSSGLLFPRTTTTLQLANVLGGTLRQFCPRQPMSVNLVRILHTFIG